MAWNSCRGSHSPCPKFFSGVPILTGAGLNWAYLGMDGIWVTNLFLGVSFSSRGSCIRPEGLVFVQRGFIFAKGSLSRLEDLEFVYYSKFRRVYWSWVDIRLDGEG